MLGGDASGALARDPVEPPAWTTVAYSDRGVFPLGLEQPLLREPPERFVERAVRGQGPRALGVCQGLCELEAVERLGTLARDSEDRELEGDEGSRFASHRSKCCMSRRKGLYLPIHGIRSPSLSRRGGPVSSTECSLRDDARDVAWQIVVAIGGGALVGAVVGGIGGRLAMLVLRLGSPDVVLGVQTDDGFEIGAFTTSTVFLLTVTAGLGGATGLAYLVLRNGLPRRGRAVVWGVFLGAVTGASTLAPGSLDFSILDPKPFAVASFVALPGIAAFLIALLLERLIEVEPWSSRLLAAGLALCALPLVPVAPVIVLVGGAMLLLRRTARLRDVIGRVGRVAVPLTVAIMTVRGVLEIWDDAHLIIG